MENFFGFLIGWPFLTSALGLAVLGTWRRIPTLLWISLLLSTPVGLYIAAAPDMPLVGLVPVAALGLAALTCRNESRRPAVVFVSVYGACLGVLAYVVLNQ
ncbi:MAG: hypothetical protein O3A63_05205 [Proteobacteria bacterium]|nr:hypothetical protein [Pseudomonadota bacterium]